MVPRQGLEQGPQQDQATNDTEHDVQIRGEAVVDCVVGCEELIDRLGEPCAGKEVDADDSYVRSDNRRGGDQDPAAYGEPKQETQGRAADEETDAAAFTADEALAAPCEDVQGDNETGEGAQDPDGVAVQKPADGAEEQAAANAGEDVDDLAAGPALGWLGVGEDGIDDNTYVVFFLVVFFKKKKLRGFWTVSP